MTHKYSLRTMPGYQTCVNETFHNTLTKVGGWEGLSKEGRAPAEAENDGTINVRTLK